MLLFLFAGLPIDRLLDLLVVLVNIGIDPLGQKAFLFGKIPPKGHFGLLGIGRPRGRIPDPGPYIGLGTVEKGVVDLHQNYQLGGTPPGYVLAQQERVFGESGGSPAPEGGSASGNLKQDGCLAWSGSGTIGCGIILGVTTDNVLEAKEEAVSGSVGNDQNVLWCNVIVVVVVAAAAVFLGDDPDKPGLVSLGRDKGRSCDAVVRRQIQKGRLGDKVHHLVVQTPNHLFGILQAGSAQPRGKNLPEFPDGPNDVLVVQDISVAVTIVRRSGWAPNATTTAM